MILEYVLCDDFTLLERETAFERGICEWKALVSIYPRKKKDRYYFSYEASIYEESINSYLTFSSGKEFLSEKSLIKDLVSKIKQKRTKTNKKQSNFL